MEPRLTGDLSLDAIMREVREELDRRPAAAAHAGADSADPRKTSLVRRALARAARALGR